VVLREMLHRPLGWVLGTLAVAAAVACVLLVSGLLRGHDAETRTLVLQLEGRASERMKALNNEARIFSKNLGFNILLLPAEQDLGRFWANNQSDVFFDQSVAEQLAAAQLDNLNHLLPVLRHRIEWPIYDGDVVLVGIRGEIYIKNPLKQKPMEQAIEPGRMLPGSTVAERLGLQAGDRVELAGKAFQVERVLEKKGNQDDISILMNLDDVQAIVERPGQISGIMALSCVCAGGRVEPIQQELAQHVSGIQVVEFTIRAQARKRARESIQDAARAEIKDIQGSRDTLRAQLNRFGTALAIVVGVLAAILVFALSLANARERRGEVAMLRAIGLSTWRILVLFEWKAGLIGLVGGLLGCCIGLGLIRFALAPQALPIWQAVAVVVAAIAVTKLAAFLPAVLAARTDPATVLSEEA